MKELKTYLRVNSTFSAISGLTMLVLFESLNRLFNISNTYVFPIIGGCLILFAAFVWFVTTRKLASKPLIKVITILDLLWVIGSFMIVLFGLFNLSKTGNTVIVIVAIWIAFLAYKQMRYNK